MNEQFTKKLEERYGIWSKAKSKFGTTSYGVIAKNLSISASQFSKLIYGTATEGMYLRSIANIDRLIQLETTKRELSEAIAENKILNSQLNKKKETSSKGKLFLLTAFGLLVGSFVMYFLLKKTPNAHLQINKNIHPLAAYFDQDFNASFNSPYLNISDVHDYCPCSAYEGSWSLSNSYKLPLPANGKPGVYYLARGADVRMKCARYDTSHIGKGMILNGYESLVNEIWIDTEHTALSPKYFDKQKKEFTQEFKSLVFEDNPQFQKVATIHSFFIDKFEIYSDSIVRKGEPCGRYASDINEELAAAYEIDLKYILNEVVGNLTVTKCASTANPFCDVNDLEAQKSIFAFDCTYTILNENLGIGGYPYRKGYRLEKQNYSDNLNCQCEGR